MSKPDEYTLTKPSGWVWMSPDGRYVKRGGGLSHGGYKYTYRLVTDINEASMFRNAKPTSHRLASIIGEKPELESKKFKLADLIPIPARETRRIHLMKNSLKIVAPEG